MYQFIVNPVAGSGYAKKIAERLEHAMKERGLACRFAYTDAPGNASVLARSFAEDDEISTVICVGGDGTLFEVASGLCDTGKPMGIIPAGTGNDFIKSVGIPKDPLEALSFLLDRKPRATDMASVNERMFINVCGTGFDVQVLDQAASFKHLGRGLLPYMMGLLKAIFRYKPVEVELTHDGVTERGQLLICSIANGRYFGGGMPICPVADVSDGMLDLVLVSDVPRRRIPRYLPALMSGKLLDHTEVTRHMLCRHAVISSPGMRLNVDGEIFSMDRAEFTIRPGCLQLIW